MVGYRSLQRSRYVDYGAALAWGAMVGLRARQAVGGDWLSALLGLQSAVVAYLLVNRSSPRGEIPLAWLLLAWSSALLPLAARTGGASLVPPSMATIFAALGLVLAIWALLSLGPAFGIAPADRGLVISGPYRWLRHPAYAGELLSVGAFVLAHAGFWNAVLFVMLLISLVVRIHMEEGVIDEYGAYALRVRRRLIPGLC
jgi:protein-S-isoprenylcysteine O-methyltransferase Ste14